MSELNKTEVESKLLNLEPPPPYAPMKTYLWKRLVISITIIAVLATIIGVLCFLLIPSNEVDDKVPGNIGNVKLIDLKYAMPHFMFVTFY